MQCIFQALELLPTNSITREFFRVLSYIELHERSGVRAGFEVSIFLIRSLALSEIEGQGSESKSI
jgi:hypothetical protein